jgi:hypothetical protein
VALVALILAMPGAAVAQRDPDATLDRVASSIAGRPVVVVCLEEGDAGYPGDYGAWGYVYLWGDNEFMATEVCDGLYALSHNASVHNVPDWKQALGALVLTHESFHLNQQVKEPGDEARTECRAIKNVQRTITLLGADEGTYERLFPYLLALHWRIAARIQEYYYEPCKVPNWWFLLALLPIVVTAWDAAR